MSVMKGIKVHQGATFEMPFAVQEPDGSPVDLTGATFVGGITYTLGTATVADFTFTIDSAGGGEATASLTAAQTAALTPSTNFGGTPATAYYDIFVTSGGKTYRAFYGRVSILRRVSS